MALSNWDCLSFGSDGKASDGVFRHPNGVSVEIYKNWLYVRDPKGWHEGTGFTGNVIAHIEKGSLSIAGIDIVSHRHSEQQAIFVFATMGYEARQMFCGIGCYGFDNPIPRMAKAAGIKFEDYDEIFSGTRWEDGKESLFLECVNGEKYEEFVLQPSESLKSQYVGITGNTYLAFREWLLTLSKDSDVLKYLENLQKPLRFNQGDQFFMDGFEEIKEIRTSPGEAQTPLLVQALEEGFTIPGAFEKTENIKEEKSS